MKIVVLAGGYSPERDVSLSSGSLIANSLMKSGHKVALVDVYEGIQNDENINGLFKTGFKYSHSVSPEEPDLEELKRKNKNRNELIGENILELCKIADIVFIALHGSIGENGQLQATFDNYGIKYTGSGYTGCLLAMDKDLTKRLIVSENIPTAEWVLIDTNSEEIQLEIPFPCIIKPCSAGSSVGISMARNEEELKNAIKHAKKYESYIIVEKRIVGREFSVGILENKALPVIEIVPSNEFYDYKVKYQNGLATEICPAEIDAHLTKKIQDYAIKVHKALRLGVYSRIDFILDENDEFICLEANALPGMTHTSLFPQEAKVAGIDYDTLCQKIVEISLN
ncbi:D-alanine--D-alanine ligase [Bacillus sp. JJ1521]|uniref:D-alanine--D-alanine ligase family protein n=1 Tax=Bacillus sp. JJ1521 TaxID=3122957 RepID=UPI002FFFE075